MGQPTTGVLLDFDGTLYTGDLPVLAYARHASTYLPDAAVPKMIGGIRAFLEGTGQLPDLLQGAEDGYHAVHLLADDGGVELTERQAAYHASREDLAGSVFALEAVPGLLELLADTKPTTYVVVLTNAPLAGVHEVLDSVGLLPLVDRIVVNAGKPESMAGMAGQVLGELAPGRSSADLLAVGDRWLADLAQVHLQGGASAYVDRFSRGDGTPNWRGSCLADLVPSLRNWIENRDV